jgi:hypothetical protein
MAMRRFPGLGRAKAYTKIRELIFPGGLVLFLLPENAFALTNATPYRTTGKIAPRSTFTKPFLL